MPTYRYRCEGCGDEFEVWQSITDDALTGHDGDGGCGGHLVKVLTPAGIVLKGSGFYKTDNRGSSSKSSNGDGAKESADKKSDDSSGSKSSTSGSESKSSSGSDTKSTSSTAPSK
jgi:putative FmdB family regulatory protein